MSTVTLLEERLTRIAAAFHQARDEQSRQGIDTLFAKLTQNQLSVAFCGHISSGKSALINTLIGAELLPTAPLPTSANIVTLRPGAAAARVFPQEGHPVDLELPGALNRIQACCQDRHETRKVAISYPYDFFGLPVTLVDTPGIDSAGMAERLVQDPAVLTADIIYYVMDYNHVQSELNFAVTKRLKERGKPVFLVINQIDKHCDFELDFAYFKHSSQAQFTAWNIRPDGLYFTTLTEPRHPENQLALLKRHLPALFQNGDQVLTTTVLTAARQLITDHCQRQAAKTAARRHQAQAVIDRYPDPTAAIREFQEIQQQRQTVESMPEQLETTLEKEINAVVQNAHITSYTTVELAARYIQSRTTGFRAGLFFAARKTEKERENRLQALFSNFSEKVHTNLEWHLRDILGKIPERFGLVDDTYLQTVNAFSVTWDAGLIAGSVCHEPVPSREYIHNFTDDIATATKALYRRAALTVAHQAVELAREHCRPQVDQLTAQLAPGSELITAVQDLDRLNLVEQQYQDSLLHTLHQGLPRLVPVDTFFRLPADITIGTLEDQPLTSLGRALKKRNPRQDWAGGGDSPAGVGSATRPAGRETKAPLQNAARVLKTFATAIAPLPGFRHMVESLNLRAARLAENIFTIALFGAFSAGKSSVANALLGDLLLPVSPNPTTAAINKILPPTGTYPHGTVRVQLKTAADIRTDVLNSLRACNTEAASLEEALERFRQIPPDSVHPTAKPHYAFLAAVARGFGAMRDQLGREVCIDLTTFQDYVASEEKACFVEWIELYYDCPLTAQGIMLVDTPGADSLNTRHTGLAFDYIKNADAILFVTYFNSAFSHADRDFLYQLGRVKDSFTLDKMFFVVNAADLAKTGAELMAVTEHVNNNVTACGIRDPRIFPVSSQTALLAKMAAASPLPASLEKTYRQRVTSLLAQRQSEPVKMGSELPSRQQGLDLSGFAAFEQAFFQFTLTDLTAVAVRAAQGEMHRCLSTLDAMIATARSDSSARLIRQAAYAAACTGLHRSLHRVDTAAEQKMLDRETGELVYYVKQRLFFRFGDIFNRFFNPAVLQDTRGVMTKKAFRQSLEALVQTLEMGLIQEVRATSLHIEKFINQRCARFRDKLARVVAETTPQCTLQAFEPVSMPTPEFSGQSLTLDTTTVLPLLTRIKNPKEFFEGQGRANFRQELTTHLETQVATAVATAEAMLREFYTAAFQERLAGLRSAAGQQVDDYYESLTAALAISFDLAAAEQIRDSLGSLTVAAGWDYPEDTKAKKIQNGV